MPRTPSTTSSPSPVLSGGPMVALAWLATLAGCTAWVKTTQIGPVVMIINDQRGWGVHAGDSWVLAGLAPMAAITVLHVVRRTRRLS